MKKFAAFLLIVALLSFASAMSESVDYKSLSDEDLSTLFEDIRHEMIDRGIIKSGELQKGEYVVGKDVAPGSYLFIGTSEQWPSYFYLVPSVELYDRFIELGKEMSIDLYGIDRVTPDSPKKLDLKDGNVLIVSNEVGLKLEMVTNMLAP